MSRRSSRITRSTRKRPREIEEDTPDVSEEIIQEQKKPRTENESKESSSLDGLVVVAAAAPGDDGMDVDAAAAPGDDGMDVDAAAAPGDDGMDVDTDVTSLKCHR